jgi:formylmethanofuran:tetrahydromethanopterin formyltransferase
MARDPKNSYEQTWISREDIQDIAKIGGDLLKRTVTSGLDVIKDVTDTLPKDASQILQKSREEVLKGLSKEVAQNIVTLAVERVFATVRDHRLDISIRVRKANESQSETEQSTADKQPSVRSPKAEQARADSSLTRSSNRSRTHQPRRR